MKNAKEIGQMLASQAEQVASMLLPNGKRLGAEWCAGGVGGEAGKSLKVHLTGAKAGVWADFSTDESGDLLDLWKAVRGVDFVTALKQAKEYLGVRDEPRDDFKKPYAKKYVKPKFEVATTTKGAAYKYLTEQRNLQEHVLVAYGVFETSHSQHGAACGFPIYAPDLSEKDPDMVKYLAVKRGEDGKKAIWATADSKPHLFGWKAISNDAREVYITEGEIDTLTLAGWAKPALSVPSGVKNLDWIEHDYDALCRFERIYIVTDNDEPGNTCADAIATRLGRERCYRVKIDGYKDANEALMSGKYGSVEFCRDVAAAKTLDPENLRNAAEYAEALWQENNPSPETLGSETPWNIEWRIRPGELTIWTGWSGHGKSLLLNHVQIHDFATTGSKILIASLEMPVGQSMAQLARMALGRNPRDRQETNSIAQYLGKGFWFYDAVGARPWRELLTTFAYAVRRYGIKRIVIDSLLRCGVAEDDYDGQKEFITAAVQFAADHNVHIHLVAHSRKKEDETKPPGKLDIRGAAAITDLCHNGWSVWRNKERETAIQTAKETSVNGTVDQTILAKPGARITCWKNRKTGVEEYCNLWMIPGSQQFTDTRQPNSRVYAC